MNFWHNATGYGSAQQAFDGSTVSHGNKKTSQIALVPLFATYQGEVVPDMFRFWLSVCFNILRREPEPVGELSKGEVAQRSDRLLLSFISYVT